MQQKRPTFFGYHPDDKAEEQAIQTLQSNLQKLDDFSADFDAAVSLFNRARSIAVTSSSRQHSPLYARWQRIAARDAAMTVYHFGQTRNTIPGLVKSVPALREFVNDQALGRAGSMFEREFPDWATVRKGIAHRGDFQKSPKRLNEHRSRDGFNDPDNLVIGTNSFIFFGESLINNTLMLTVEGKYRTLDITEETAAKLRLVVDVIYDALKSAAVAVSPFFNRKPERFGDRF